MGIFRTKNTAFWDSTVPFKMVEPFQTDEPVSNDPDGRRSHKTV